MKLTTYRKKRNFKESPEPTGGKPGKDKLRFVVQKHHASRLHYDFRLELDGVLKSWAVPKGPSLDPEVKRLAMMVEDHPYDYRNFEGIIPSGYGAGTVIVWDEGTYEPYDGEGKSKRDQEKLLRKQMSTGKLKFELYGKKLKGLFALVKAKQGEENAWLLMKVTDQYVSDQDILEKDKSVVSKKTLEQVKKTSTDYWESKPPKKKNNAAPSKKKTLTATKTISRSR